jgi:hypothetical protein
MTERLLSAGRGMLENLPFVMLGVDGTRVNTKEGFSDVEPGSVRDRGRPVRVDNVSDIVSLATTCCA